VVAAIEPSMQLAEIERIRHKAPANLNAYDHLLRAQQLENEFTEPSYAAALDHCKRAIASDPNYAPALALAAYIYGWRRTQGWMTDAAAETAEGLVLLGRALERGKLDANVTWMGAYAGWQLGLDDKRVLELCHRSVEMNPNSAVALSIAGRTESVLGNYAKGKELLERAQRLNPRDPRGWLTTQGMMFGCLGEGRYEEGVAWGRKALAQNPRNTGAMRLLASNLAHLGQIDAARQIIADNLRIEPGLTITKFRTRRMFMHEDLWVKFAEGLRLAGLPE
jgi:tetratricopeptide (TPR) repeat protein